jgi:hypothetical protein
MIQLADSLVLEETHPGRFFLWSLMEHSRLPDVDFLACQLVKSSSFGVSEEVASVHGGPSGTAGSPRRTFLGPRRAALVGRARLDARTIRMSCLTSLSTFLEVKPLLSWT